MKKFAFIAALYFCIACGLRAETPETIIEQASKRLEAYKSIADTPFRLAFSLFLDDERINRNSIVNKVENFDKELIAKHPPIGNCSLRFLSPDKFRLDIAGPILNQISYVVAGNRFQTTERCSGKRIESSVSTSLKRIVEFLDVRGPKNLLANYRKCTVIDGGDTTVEGIKCRRIDLIQSESSSVAFFIESQNKELVATNVTCEMGVESLAVSYKYTSLARPGRGTAFVGYPAFVSSESGIDNMRIEINALTKMENADESILQIFE